jgi:hypothetical protein
VSYAVKDSGQRQEFASGMVRDVTTGKVDWHRVADGPMLGRWAKHLTVAVAKYQDIAPGVPNWTLAAGEEELARFRASAFRHFMQWLNGDTDEDHAAALFFNVNGFEYVRSRVQDSAPFINNEQTKILNTDITEPVGPQGWTVTDAHKMRP